MPILYSMTQALFQKFPTFYNTLPRILVKKYPLSHIAIPLLSLSDVSENEDSGMLSI